MAGELVTEPNPLVTTTVFTRAALSTCGAQKAISYQWRNA
jgi:hypothetical protein